MKSTLLKLLVALFTLSLVAAACGSDDDTADSGDSDALAEAEAALAAAEDAIEAAEAEAAEAQAAAEAASVRWWRHQPACGHRCPHHRAGPLASRSRRPDGRTRPFAEANDMTIFYVGSADWESEINVQIEAGTPPDISIFPQPGKLADFARDGFLVPLPDDVTAAVSENWSAGAMGFGNVDGTQYGVPDKTDLKSLVWYQPARFEANGYRSPPRSMSFRPRRDHDRRRQHAVLHRHRVGYRHRLDLHRLGRGHDARRHSGETYDAWTTGELPSPATKSRASCRKSSTCGTPRAWSTPRAAPSPHLVPRQRRAARQRRLHDAPPGLLLLVLLPRRHPVQDGSEGASTCSSSRRRHRSPIVLTSGTWSARSTTPEVMAVMEYFGSPEFANLRQSAQKEAKGGGDVLSGFNTANLNVDRSLWNPLAQSFLGHGEQRRALRRLGPHAGRRRRRLVLDRGHGARQR